MSTQSVEDELRVNAQVAEMKEDAEAAARLPMSVIYIAGPYRAATQYQVERNIRRAEAMMLLVAELGYAVLCPHTMTRYIDGVFPDEYWLEATLELMRRCDAVVCCNGWESSEGTRGEIEEAERLGLPVHTSFYSLLSNHKETKE